MLLRISKLCPHGMAATSCTARPSASLNSGTGCPRISALPRSDGVFWDKLSQKSRISIGSIELPHSPEIVGGETVSRRKLFGKILGESLHDGFPPTQMGLPLQNSSPDVPIQKDQIAVHCPRGGNARRLDAALEFRDKLNVFGAQWEFGFHHGSKASTVCGNLATSCCQFLRQVVAESTPGRGRGHGVCAGINWWSSSPSPQSIPYLHAAVTRWIRSATTLGTAPVNGSVPQVLADPSRAA
jgi:hypothetical protein